MSNHITGALFSLAGQFPQAYIGGVFSGQAIGGVFPSVANVGIIAFGATPPDAALFLFTTAAAFMAGSLVIYPIVVRSGFFQYYTEAGLHSLPANESAQHKGANKC